MRWLRMMAWMVLPLLAACTGPKGDTGPMGPSGGAGTPIYYYNNSFDSGGVSEWKTYQSIGANTIQAILDESIFQSPYQCLGINFNSETGLDSMAYISLPITLNSDCWTEFDWYMNGATAGGFEFFEFMGGSTKNAIIGFDSINLYLVQNSSKVNVAAQPNLLAWHHITIKVSAITGKSSYWMDGLTLGTDFNTGEIPNGSPPSGYLIGIDSQAGSDSVTHIDNLKCYHY